nr:hypothetical protein [Bacteroidota bacterium]
KDFATFIDKLQTGSAEFSLAYELAVPNSVDTSQQIVTPTWIIKLYNIRKVQPTTGLPPTAISNSSYLDNLFGPIDIPPFLRISNVFQWVSGFKKKYVNAIDELGLGFMAKIGMAISPEGVLFTAVVTEYHTLRTNNEIDDLDRFVMSTGSSNNSASLSDYNSPNMKPKNLVWAKDELNIQTDVIQLNALLSSTQQKFLHQKFTTVGLALTEYVNLLSTAAALDHNLHDIYLNISYFGSQQQDDSDKFYRTFSIGVGGLDSSGIYTTIQPIGGTLLAYSGDNLMVNTKNAFVNIDFDENATDPNAYYNVATLISSVEAAEFYYMEVNIPNDSVLNIITRIRVHSYGPPRFSLNGYGFNLVIAGNDGFASIVDLDDLKNFNGTAYLHLTAGADEGIRRDNPGPYLTTPDNEVIDFGHALFGLDALNYNNVTALFYANPTGFGIGISTDLAGLIADIITPVAEVYYHRVKGKPCTDAIHYPDNADLQRYYEISATLPDLLGDIEAFGLRRAFLAVSNSANAHIVPFTFSDVLRAYYNIAPRAEIAQIGYDTNVGDFTYQHRLKIFCLENGFISLNFNTRYDWHPDGPTSNPNNFDIRSHKFAVFWWNKINGFVRTVYNSVSTSTTTDLFPINLDVINNNPNYLNDFSYCKNTFFNDLKSRLLIEQGSNFLNP